MEPGDPGTSLFQGNDLNNFDSIAQREEEEEAIEEQKRRDLELKNMLENAFDDVSFDVDEESICNGSQNNSSSSQSVQQNKSSDFENSYYQKTPANRVSTDVDRNCSNIYIDSCITSPKHTARSSHLKRVAYNNDSDNYSDQNHKIVQNGNLHDIIDASGGGGQTSVHFNHCLKRNSADEIVFNGVSTDCDNLNEQLTDAIDSSEQLKVLYDIRVREVHKLTEMVDSMRLEHEIETKELKHQIAIMMAEKERANISHSQLQSLLITSKQQAEELLKNIKTLEKTNKELESLKKSLMLELDTTKLTVDDLQRKIIILEKGNKNKIESAQYESNLKTLTEKHTLELSTLNQELNTYKKNNENLIKENEELKLKFDNLSQKYDENMTKKSEIISRLSKQIEETQKQCENFMKLSTAEENFRLQTEIKLLKEDKSLMTLKIENLEKENKKQDEELKQYESLSKVSFLNCSASDSKGSISPEVNSKLGAELYRSLNNQKAKRQEIRNLQDQLNEKQEQISLLTENEKVMKLEILKCKEEISKNLSEINKKENTISAKQEEISSLQSIIDKLNKEIENFPECQESGLRELEKENKLLKDEIAKLDKEKTEAINSYNEEYLRFHNDGLERVRKEVEEFYQLDLVKKEMEIENLKKEVEEVKNLYVEVFSIKETLVAEIEKEKENSNKSCDISMEEVKKLQRELEKSRQRILELDQTLKQQYQQEVEILNLDINQLNLQIEKLKKEKDREVSEKDKIIVENELLKSEIEHVTSEKNLLFLNCDKLQKKIEELQKIEEKSVCEINQLTEKHELELQNIGSKYEITIKKLKKELELCLAAKVKCESKYTSPMKTEHRKNGAVTDKSTSPIHNAAFQESSISPRSSSKKSKKVGSLQETLSYKDISVLTDPEPLKIPKKEVIEIMEKLGAHHEEEMRSMENKYRTELLKLDKKLQIEIDRAKEIIRKELVKEHMAEIQQIEEKHRVELENRIEQEKKEAVVDLITEWACEVQSLKMSYAEAQEEMEKMKMKYKAAKNMALQYKTYFKSKTEYMKEEWKRIEDGYERALKELEKNVHILVDVKEDEVKAKVDSITKVYEQKISKMKKKLSKCEDRLKSEKGCENKMKADPPKSQEVFDFRAEIEKLSIPEGNLSQKTSSVSKKKMNNPVHLYENVKDEGFEVKELASQWKKKSKEEATRIEGCKVKYTKPKPLSKEDFSDKERTSR